MKDGIKFFFMLLLVAFVLFSCDTNGVELDTDETPADETPADETPAENRISGTSTYNTGTEDETAEFYFVKPDTSRAADYEWENVEGIIVSQDIQLTLKGTYAPDTGEFALGAKGSLLGITLAFALDGTVNTTTDEISEGVMSVAITDTYGEVTTYTADISGSSTDDFSGEEGEDAAAFALTGLYVYTETIYYEAKSYADISIEENGDDGGASDTRGDLVETDDTTSIYSETYTEYWNVSESAVIVKAISEASSDLQTLMAAGEWEYPEGGDPVKYATAANGIEVMVAWENEGEEHSILAAEGEDTMEYKCPIIEITESSGSYDVIASLAEAAMDYDVDDDGQDDTWFLKLSITEENGALSVDIYYDENATEGHEMYGETVDAVKDWTAIQDYYILTLVE